MFIGRRYSSSIVAACLVISIEVLVPAAARAQKHSWEIELHGGGMLPTNPTSGVAALPAPGSPFTTAGIYGPPAPPVLVMATSRRVSSW
jgi:hypothetical protein